MRGPRDKSAETALEELARAHGTPSTEDGGKAAGRGMHVSRTGREQRRLSVYLPPDLGDEVIARAARRRVPYSVLIAEVLAAAFGIALEAEEPAQ